MILEKEQWRQFVKGFHVTDGAIGFNNTRYCFVLEETKRNIHRDPPPVVRLLFVRMERPPERRCYSIDFPHFEFPRVAATTMATGAGEFLVADMDGRVIVYNDEVPEIGPEPVIIPTNPIAGIRRLKQVNGKLYAIGGYRNLLERRGAGQWQMVTGIECADANIPNLRFGFSDMDAFGPGDIYAVGGKGDVWHYNGVVWQRCVWENDESLKTVCCAGNGLVYITTVRGNIWVGRDNNWTKTSANRNTTAYNDTVWFAGKLWMAKDSGLEQLDGDTPRPAGVPPEVQLTTRHLSCAADGSLLLSAGQHGASLYNGTEWQVLFNTREFEKKQA